MKYLKKIIVIIPLFLYSCTSTQYLKNYEPINVFLETQKLDKNRKYILQSNKEENNQALRVFNGNDGLEHLIDSANPIDYTGGLFVEKHWKKMYKSYSNDSIKKYWKKEDFPNFNFALEKGTGLVDNYILTKYMNTGIHEIIIISEPMFYMNKKYILFYFNKVYFEGSSSSKVVIMKKEKDSWVIVRVIGDYIFS